MIIPRMYKALTVNGEWVEGYYIKASAYRNGREVHSDLICSEMSQNGEWGCSSGSWVVKPETICEQCFLGRLDVEGKRFYTGDIVFDPDSENGFVVVRIEERKLNEHVYYEKLFDGTDFQDMYKWRKLIILGNVVRVSEQTFPDLVNKYKAMLDEGYFI